MLDAEQEEIVITSTIDYLRDPFILVDGDSYYAYGTGWVCYKNTSGLLSGNWIYLGQVAEKPVSATDSYWAPEVYKYNGSYYMFATYYSEKTMHRGCTVMKSESPEGPFYEISDGHLTPPNWDAIDGTLYVDQDGQPWIVFSHEWTSTEDKIGRIVAAKLSENLDDVISEPIEILKANEPDWSRASVTDGSWMYRCENGELLMLWSNLDENGYCVAISRSDNGRIDGNWLHDNKLLYSKSMTDEYDGGHGMIFRSITGKLYLCIHSPNFATGTRRERPVFIAICEENGTLVWDE